jgi:hypothetical protein
MSIVFSSLPDPPAAVLSQVASLAPTNPFFTAEYVQAKRDLGYQPWVLGIQEDQKWLTVFPALVRRGRWSRLLEIESLPAIAHPEVFWKGLVHFHKSQRITHGEIGTYGSPPVSIPAMGGEMDRRPRCEHIWPLQGPDVLTRAASYHKKNIKRAKKAGLELRVVGDSQACREHAGLIAFSMERRELRGESVPDDLDTAGLEALLHRRTGQLFQATAHGEVVSSLLILSAAKGAYCFSAGTGRQGMACGASPWLFAETARILQERGMEVFNLGGALESNPGLFRFKADFGATPVRLEEVTYYWGSQLAKKCKTAWRACRDGLRRLFNAALRRRTIAG